MINRDFMNDVQVVFCADGRVMATGDDKLAENPAIKKVFHVKTRKCQRGYIGKRTRFYLERGGIEYCHMKGGQLQLTSASRSLLEAVASGSKVYPVISRGLYRVRLPKGTSLAV